MATRADNKLTLRISAVTTADANEFMCEANNDAGSAKRSTHIMIKHAPVMRSYTTGA